MLPGNRPSGQLALQSGASFNQTANLQCRKQTSTQANRVSSMRLFSDITANQIIPQALSSGSSWWQTCMYLRMTENMNYLLYLSNENLKETADRLMMRAW